MHWLQRMQSIVTTGNVGWTVIARGVARGGKEREGGEGGHTGPAPPLPLEMFRARLGCGLSSLKNRLNRLQARNLAGPIFWSTAPPPRKKFLATRLVTA